MSSLPSHSVKVIEEIDDSILSSGTALTLGLIVNEIATNAIKHGFTGHPEPCFTCAFTQDETGDTFVLTLSNNGPPIPEEIDIETSPTLGLSLISNMVMQLDGTVELQRAPHPIFTIRFPVPHVS